ncbi:hypothetical protein ACJ73_05514 [Blastomyces percursus]|uniref:Histone chaperone domain-containing protein n=1 Tax=Blastomyces percursus TaxID=1658174 RepID=A0A1J9R3Q4_9EURO|nr:hypothetical protein ACJ73_05514 [Blastomyces percursus]
MSNPAKGRAEDLYEEQNDAQAPSPVFLRTVTYTSKGPVSVQSDQAPVEDPMGSGAEANTDEQLARDEEEAIDKSNILKGDRTRHAKPQAASGYSEGPGEEDLPESVVKGTEGRSRRTGEF